MFILHSSNKTENLLVHLTSVLENIPLSSPLSKEIFLIQSQGMERWLSQQITSHFGVWGNFEFFSPNQFFNIISKKIDTQVNNNAFDREQMLWLFEQLLRQIDDDCFKPIHYYIQGENKALKRFQLAQKLAQTFDQYQIMRSDMLKDWSQGKLTSSLNSEIWQRALWQRVTKIIGHDHRGSLWQNIINKLDSSPEGELSPLLPERIFVFGLNTMPPLFLAYLQSLSRHCDIHLFLLNPAKEYWADLANKRHVDETLEGHPLLSTLGQQGREFQQMLLEQASFNYEPESFEEIEVTNNLQQLQNDILNNQLQKQSLEKDSSISIHACHSRMREVDVLKDQLLYCLEQDTQLELRDIIVMAPDIQPYAPFISAIFNDIQYAIADKSLRISNTSLDAFIQFLQLSQGRFGWQSIMDLLQQPVVYPNFSLSEIDIDLIKHWVADTQVRWGKSAKHKEELGLPELTENTWQATLDRLLMGYAVGNEDDFVNTILPYSNIEGSSALALGGLNDFIQLLFKASDELKKTTTLKSWVKRLYYYAEQLLFTHAPVEQLEQQQLNEVFEALANNAQSHTEQLSLEVIIAWIESRVSEHKSSTGFLRGQLTFCSMLPMRSIPFKVIALLGLNEGEFPKIDCHPSFDLMGQNFRKGDRSRRTDDRYQFLEILLSARQQLIITYKGLSIHTNNTIAPSVVISELLDVLKTHYQLPDLITHHPLQAFSQQYFSEKSNYQSFSQTNYEIAIALRAKKQEPESWWQGSIQTEKTNIITINDLFDFYRHPQNYFFQQRLGIRFATLENNIEEREPFIINSLDEYAINQQWIERILNNQSFSLKKLQAEGRWLSGAYGELKFEQKSQEINQFTNSIKDLNLGLQIKNQAIDITLNNYRLIGNLDHLYKQDSLFYRYADLKGKDFIQALLHHLIINQVQAQNTYILSKNGSHLIPSSLSNPEMLAHWINFYLQGQQKPSAFFTESAFSYVKHTLNPGKSKKTAIVVARERLKKETEYTPSLQQLYRTNEEINNILSHSFEEQCNNLFLPAWKSTKVI